jgi:hypothetical protein
MPSVAGFALSIGKQDWKTLHATTEVQLAKASKEAILELSAV